MAQLNDSMREFLNGCHYATLATLDEDGSIHQTPVWYLFEDGCFFVSTSSDRKVRNLLTRPRASLLVDSRRNPGSTMWVSASGTAEVIRGERAKEINAKIPRRYLTKAGLKDPRIGPVFAAAGEVTIRLRPHSWRSWEFKNDDAQFFGGLLGQAPERWFLPVD